MPASPYAIVSRAMAAALAALAATRVASGLAATGAATTARLPSNTPHTHAVSSTAIAPKVIQPTAAVEPLASRLAPASVTVRSESIIGSSGVKAKRPMPMATASETRPARAMARVDEGAREAGMGRAVSHGPQNRLGRSRYHLGP